MLYLHGNQSTISLKNTLLEFNKGWYYSSNLTPLSNATDRQFEEEIVLDYKKQFGKYWYVKDRNLYINYKWGDEKGEFRKNLKIANNIKDFVIGQYRSNGSKIRYYINQNNKICTIVNGYKSSIRLVYMETDAQKDDEENKSKIKNRTYLVNFIICLLIIFLPKKFLGKIQLCIYCPKSLLQLYKKLRLQR